MSLLHKINKSGDYWKLFPESITQGSYDPISQSIALNSFKKTDYESFTNQINPLDTKEFLGVYFHELNHWIDNLSTLWGQKNLINIYNALNSFLKYDAKEFWYIVKANSAIYRSFLSEYYTTINDSITWDGQPWHLQLSAGYEFGIDGKIKEDRPIVFTNFRDSKGNHICRIPFTICALTESISTFAEMVAELSVIHSLNSTNRDVELNLWNREYMERIYDNNLAIYFVSAHYLANVLKIKDIYLTLELSSKLAALSLNIPDSLFNLVKIPEDPFKTWGDKNTALLANKDRGYIYLLLCFNAPKNYNKLSHKDWINQTLYNTGLPEIDSIYEMALKEMIALEQSIIKGPLNDRIEYLLTIGRHNYELRGVYADMSAQELFIRDEIYTPQVILGDDTIIQLGNKIMDKNRYNIIKAIELSWKFYNFSNEFLSACKFQEHP